MFSDPIIHVPPQALQRSQVVDAMRDAGVESSVEAVAWCLQFLQRAAWRLTDSDCDPLAIADEAFIVTRVAADYHGGAAQWPAVAR